MDKSAFLRNLDVAAELLNKSDICGEQLSRLKSLRKRLEDREFIISVFGQFKRGKSTLINSILEENILPVGIVPVTSVVTQIKYGRKGAVVFSQNGYHNIPLEELDDYINEQSNPDNTKKVDSVQINYPSKLLSSGIIIVDTPGVGSMHKHNSDVAYAFVKNSDAVIFMLCVDSPINEIERDFLTEIKEYASKIYFAVNKVDTVEPNELAQYIDYCKKLLHEITGVNDVKLYPVCAKDRQDDGLKQLITDILSDITVSGDDILLESIRIKSADILKEAQGQVQLYISALGMPLNKLEETAKALENRLNTLESISKDTSYLIDQRTDELMGNIRKVFENEQEKIIAYISDKINAIYKDEPLQKSRLLEDKFERVMEAELSRRLAELNNNGISMLKNGYEGATSIFGESLQKIRQYLSAVIKELFNVEYRFDEDTYTLSEATDFYIDVNKVNTAFFIDVNSMVHFLPKQKANIKVLERALKSVNSDVVRNVTNMLSDYSYKIRESKRSFSSQFISRANELRTGFRDFTERIISERRIAGDQYGEKIEKLEELNLKLSQGISELTGSFLHFV